MLRDDMTVYIPEHQAFETVCVLWYADNVAKVMYRGAEKWARFTGKLWTL